jgi:16S rRNA (cytosine1402-N4)-methyltransferase
MDSEHVPVMLDGVIDAIKPYSGGRYLDMTAGGGGYTFAIARIAAPAGEVIAFDLDGQAIEKIKNKAKAKGIKNIKIIKSNFKYAKENIFEIFPGKKRSFDGIVFDLGLSSAQLADRNRGFSFVDPDSPLVMNFSSDSAENQITAERILNDEDGRALSKLFHEYGEEKHAARAAREIIKERINKRIKTVGDLNSILEKALPKNRGKIHPFTKIYQALRIAVNNELENLKTALPDAVSLLKPGGRIAVVSFHSLEDRIVKRYFRNESKNCLCPPDFPICACGHKKNLRIITPRPIIPKNEELKRNPRSRSAKLRVAEKLN